MEIFEKFVKKYDFNNERVALKYSHTLRVQALCEMIAKSLNMDKKDMKIASYCGLFHDIGRFEQVKMYNTFNDLESIDHGDLGYKIFLRVFAPKLDLDEEDIEIIAKSILYHNKYKVGRVNKRTKIFCDLVRDADKIDIFYLMTGVKNMLNIADDAPTKKCTDSFMEHKQISNKDKLNGNDVNLCMLAFIWDINYDESFKIIKDNKYIEKVQKRLKNNLLDEYFEEIYKYLKEK